MCHRLEEFLGQKQVAKALGSDFIDLKIDIDRMTHGKEVAKRLRGGGGGGIPWMVIVDAKGEALVDSDGPKGNVGCPVQPHERSHFLHMLKVSKQRMTDGDMAVVESSLDTFAEKILAERR